MRLGLKLFVASVLVVLIPLGLLNRYAMDFFERFAREAWEEEMVDTAYLMGSLWQADLSTEVRKSVLDRHALRSEMRLQWFSGDGKLLYDSGGALDVVTLLGPEVDEARSTGRYQARFELNHDHSKMYYFSALPFLLEGDGDPIQGIAHVIRHTGPITAALFQMKENQVAATSLSCVIAGTVSLLFAWLLTRRLRHLQRGARAYALTGNSHGFQVNGRDEVAQLSREFDDMTRALEARQDYNREFVLTTLHELKTPLTAIRGAAGILTSHSDLEPERRNRFCENILFQSERLSRLVAELHELTCLDVDLLKEEGEVLDLSLWIPRCVERLQPGVSATIRFLGTEAPLPVLIPADRLEQVMANLVENASRHSPKATDVDVRCSRNGTVARVEVLDQGDGVDPEHLDRIFDRFFTTVRTGVTQEQGSGLGLAVVKSVVESAKGRVFVENRDCGGACIGFELPVADS